MLRRLEEIKLVEIAGDVGVKSLAIPVIMGFAAWLKKYTVVSNKAIPLIVVAMCVAVECFAAGNASAYTILKGAGWGFVTVGLYSAAKNTAEGLRR